MKRKNRVHRGFTFVELMIVAVVAAILVISALPDAKSSERRTAWEFMARLEADIEYAKSLSIGRPDDLAVIRFDTQADAYWLARASAPDTPILHPQTREPYIVQAGNSADARYRGVKIKGLSVGEDNTMVFDSFGGVQHDTNAVVQIQYRSVKLEANVSNLTGRSTVLEGFSVAIAGSENSNNGNNGNGNGNGGSEDGEDGADLGDIVDGLLSELGNLGNGNNGNGNGNGKGNGKKD